MRISDWSSYVCSSDLSSCPPRQCCQSFCSASVMSLRKRRAFRSVVVVSGGFTVVLSPYPHPSPRPPAAGATTVGPCPFLLPPVLLRHPFSLPLPPSPFRRQCGPRSNALLHLHP